ncbi:MAG: two-component system sensor histidine kinase NtrB [Pyrinomonadaceae bacterium]
MNSLDQNPLSANSHQMQKVQTLVIGRLVLIFLLLVTSWTSYSGPAEFSFQNFPQGTFLVCIVSVGLTAIYFLLLRISRALAWQVRVQFGLDALLITWLVWRTGDLSSPYITLYIVLIAASSFYLRPRSTMLMSMVCAGLFTALATLVALSAIETTGTPLSSAKIIQVVSFHVVAFLVVGILAARLAEGNSSSVELHEATKSLANLRALHERIIESIRSGLITTDLDGTIYTFNAAATEITGHRSGAMHGRSIYELIPGFRDSIDLSKGNSIEQMPRFESELSTPDGFAVRIGYSISNLYSEENEASGFIITFQDLTEIRSMEESVRRKDRLAAVGRVGAGLAHEIRNPLGAMRGAIQVLESNTPPESVQSDLMSIILRESDRLNSIITNFLNYARPKVGSFGEIDLCEAVRETVKLMRHSPDIRTYHIIEEVLPEGSVFVSADATQLKQIFWNLSRNAIQAMPGGGKLKISVETTPNSRVRIIFEDSGNGMTPDQVERLFEPFSSSTSGGTGLGLSIVYQIIRDHNGAINVRSFEGEGTVITVELPREIRQEPKIPEAEAMHISSTPTRLKEYLKVKNEESEISS